MNPAIVNSLDEEVWREFVDRHPQGNIFHTPEMFQVFVRAEGHRPKLWAAVDDKHEVLALLTPVQITLSNGIMRHMTTRSIAYGSALCTLDSRGKEALGILLSEYTQETKHNALYTELRHLSDPSAIRPVLDHCGYASEDHLNYVIDLNRSEQDIWQAISKNTRKAIRKSRNKGVVPEEIKDSSLIPIFYDLLRQTYKRVGVPLADISLFEAVFDILVPKGMAKMVLAQFQNTYVAASLEIPYKDVIYSWYSGYDRNWRSAHANDGLVWYILEWGAENGYRFFDFGGAGQVDVPYGVRDFKAKFGGRLVNFGRHTCVHAPLTLSLSRVGYQIYRQIFRFSPAIYTKSTNGSLDES